MKDNLSDLEWTGERYVPHMRGTIALEHLHRYAYACEYVQGKIVLDIASGEGYGSEMLSRTASHVYGVDIDSASVNHAKAKYCTDKLTFKLGNCTEIPLEDASVDVVVSFETIEHVGDHEQMMLEIRRILRPGGVMIMSSPERHEYSEVPKQHNPFHVHELYHEEFITLLKKHFKHTACFGQRVIHGSALVEMGTPSAISKNYQFDQLPQHIVASNGLPRPIYLIGVCSDHPIQVASGGVCEQDINQSEIISEKYAQIQGLNEAVGQRNAQIQGLNEAVGQRNAQIQGLNEAVGQRDEQIQTLNKIVSELRSSTSWRLTAPLRFFCHLLKGDYKIASHVVKNRILRLISPKSSL